MIGVTRDGHVMTLEMQREGRRNALNSELVDGLREAVEKAAAEDVRAIVLTGQGGVFSSGADLTDAAGVAEELPDKAKALNLAIDQTPVPVIGAINGPAIGAGVQSDRLAGSRFGCGRLRLRGGHTTADAAYRQGGPTIAHDNTGGCGARSR